MPTTVGVDVGSTAVRAVQLKVSKGGVTLERLGQVMLPPGAVRDGEIVEAGQVTAALQTLFAQYKFKSKKVATGVANQQVVVRQLDLPYLPEDELRDSIPFTAQEYVPFPLDEAVYDLSVLESYETEEGQRFSRVLLVASRAPMIHTLMATLQGANLDTLSIDLDAFSMLRTFIPHPSVAEPGGEMLVDVGAEITNIVVHENGVPRFVRILPMGGDAITEGLTAGLGVDREEADRLKQTIGLVPPGTPVENPEAARVILERTNRFVEELRGSLDYYRAQADAVQVDRVTLTGGGSLLTNLPERLADALRLEVRLGAPLGDLDVGKTGLDNDQLVAAAPFLAVAVGLALGAAE